MNILVLHGEDTVTSLNRFSEVIKKCREKNWEIARLADNNLSLADLINNNSLFSKKRLFVVEGVNLLKKQDFEFISKNSTEEEDFLLIYNAGKIPATIIKGFPAKTKIEESKIPVFIWNFLDSFYPGNLAQAFRLFKKVYLKEPPEMIISFLSRHIVSLYMVKMNAGIKSIPEWRQSKLKNQASKFSDTLLKEVIAELSRIDVLIKTSRADAIDLLDILMLSKLR